MVGMVSRFEKVWEHGDGSASSGEGGDSSPFDLRQRIPERVRRLCGGVKPDELVDEVCTTGNGGADNDMLFEVGHKGDGSVLRNFDKEAEGFGDFIEVGSGDAA